jgi:acyl-CoA thioester hydrolase
MKITQAEPRGSSNSTKSAPPKLTDFPVQTLEKLRFADTDQQGHITNTVFAVCCQNARMELLCDPRRVPIPDGTQFVIGKLVLEFRAEMHWPGTVEVGTRIERIGRASVTLAQGLFVNGRCVAMAESIVALMDTTTRRSKMLPHETSEALRAIAKLSCDGVASAVVQDAQPAIHRWRPIDAGLNGSKAYP